MSDDMNIDKIPQSIREDIDRMELAGVVTDVVLARLGCYLDFLLEANTRVNLTAVRDRDLAWQRLILDSLTLLPGLEGANDGAKLIDVGSGGGLPGVPLAIALPGYCVTLLESTGKKARFLETCIAELKLDSASAINDRAEVVGQDPAYREVYDVAVSRAVGSVRCVLEYTLPLVRVGGRVLLVKGAAAAERELDEAADAMAILGAGDLKVYDAYPPGFDNQTVIIEMVKDRETPRQYPRRTGTPKQTPL